MTTKVNLAFIGLGRQGSKHLESFIKYNTNRDYKIVGICDLVMPIFKYGIPYFSNYLDLYRKTKPDIVVIATPNSSHKVMVLDALSLGINVIKEKPLAVSFNDAKKMISYAQKRGKIIATMQECYYSPLLLRTKRIMPSLGKLKSFYYKKTLNDTINSWRWDVSQAGGGVWLNIGWHAVSATLYLFDTFDFVELVSKSGSKRTWDYQTDHSVIVKIKINGAKGLIFVSCINTKSEVFKISFSKGIIYLTKNAVCINNNGEMTYFIDKTTKEEIYGMQLLSLINMICKNEYDMTKDLKVMDFLQKGTKSLIYD